MSIPVPCSASFLSRANLNAREAERATAPQPAWQHANTPHSAIRTESSLRNEEFQTSRHFSRTSQSSATPTPIRTDWLRPYRDNWHKTAKVRADIVGSIMLRETTRCGCALPPYMRRRYPEFQGIFAMPGVMIPRFRKTLMRLKG